MNSAALDVLTVLASGRPITAPQIAECTGQHVRSVRRHIAALRAEGHRIEASRGAGGGYVMRGSSMLPPLRFSAEEAFLLTLALRNLTAAGMRDMIEGAGDTALTKLRSILPHSVVANVDRASTTVDAVPGNEPQVDLDLFLTLATAVDGCLRIDAEYTRPPRFGQEGPPEDAAAAARTTTRHLEPYRLVLFGAHWYLLAWDLDRDDWRTFRLDRFGEVHTTTFTFPPRAHPDPVDHVRRAVTRRDAPHSLVVRLHAPAHRMSPQVPARAGTVRPESETTCTLELAADEPAWLVAHLLVLGCDFTVLDAPPEVRSVLGDVHRRLGRALDGPEQVRGVSS
ncbi:helix-turn-helix transcriptional regulator [Brevibacterium litoralis]|uniref:helix-turn-helix transcriptional regulator n=1 Tax=Brevibacterium litoralis TaxID=3138935 RepID=UPI0032EE9F8C